MFCQIQNGQVRVTIDAGERYCTEYIGLIEQASNRATELTETARLYSQQTSIAEDSDYWLSVALGYESQQRKLAQFATLITDAMDSFERVFLLRVQ